MDVNVSIPEVAIANIKYGEIVAGAKELKIQYVGKSKSKITLEILEEVEKKLEYIPEGEEGRHFSKELVSLYNQLVDLISVKDIEENVVLEYIPENCCGDVVDSLPKDCLVKDSEEESSILGENEKFEDNIEPGEGVCLGTFLEDNSKPSSLEESKEETLTPIDILPDVLEKDNKTDTHQETISTNTKVRDKKLSANFRVKSMICEEILNGEVMWQTNKKKQIKRINEKLLAEGIICKSITSTLHNFYHSIMVLKYYKLLKEDFPQDFEIE